MTLRPRTLQSFGESAQPSGGLPCGFCQIFAGPSEQVSKAPEENYNYNYN